MTRFAWMRPRSHVSRRKTALIRCVVAAALFVAVVLLHKDDVSREAAEMVEWAKMADWTKGMSTGVAEQKPQPTEATVPPQKSKDEPQQAVGNATTDQKAIDDNDNGLDNGSDIPSTRGKAVQSTLADTVLDLVRKFPPSGIDPPWPTDRHDSKPWHWGEPEPVNATDLLTLDQHELTKMKRAHRGFIGSAENRLPQYVRHSYPGDDKVTATSNAPRRGIVTVGGGKYFVILAVSLRFLRRSGTTLPVEVFVAEAEYEKTICEDVLPQLNAVCRVYPKLDDGKTQLQGFQRKTFALLFSTFDEILFLDADNSAMRDVAPLFDSAPFQTTGLVTWPDYWEATVSPLYYEIASAATAPAAVPVTARPSTETGQLLIDKQRHWKTLLLATYYNFYGPRFYYRLLNQGFTGMGDKETFLPAAAVFRLPSYQVHTPVERVGHRFEDNSTGGRVNVQFDPVDDWAVTAAAERSLLHENAALPTNEAAWKAQYANVRPLFLHANWPKWDPANLLGHVSKWSDMTVGVDGRPEPAFHWPLDCAAKIAGTERMLWEEARWVACHLNHNRLRHWQGNQHAERMCKQLHDHFARVLDTDVGAQMGLGPKDALYLPLPEMTV